MPLARVLRGSRSPPASRRPRKPQVLGEVDMYGDLAGQNGAASHSGQRDPPATRPPHPGAQRSREDQEDRLQK